MRKETLKTLLRREKELLSEIEDIKNTKKNIEIDLSHKNNKLQKIRNQISTIQKEVIVSEHAVIRYIERVMGIDIKEIERIIVDEQTEKIIKEMKPKRLNRGDFSILIKENQVTTVITNDE